MSPFRALRYDPDVAGPAAATSAPPYDAPAPVDHHRHRTANPYTVLELIAGGAGDFDGAAATLSRWLRTGVLVEDRRPALHVYEEHWLRRGVPAVQRGVVATVDLADLDDGGLLLHEEVDPDRAALRAERLRAVPVDVTPVVALHDAGEAVEAPLDAARGRQPVAAFTDDDGVDHRLWRVEDPDAIAALVAAFGDVTGVLADGHHRVAAARRALDLRRASGLPAGGWARTTVWMVDVTTTGPELEAVHRRCAGAPSRDPDGRPVVPGFRAVEWPGDVVELARTVAQAPGLAIGLVTAADRWVLRALDPRGLRRSLGRPPALAALDAQVVADVVVPSLGGGATEAVVDLATAVREVARRAAPGEVEETLLVLAPPTAEQVLAVARAGLRMPAKTTWFWPKPRAGLVMRHLR